MASTIAHVRSICFRNAGSFHLWWRYFGFIFEYANNFKPLNSYWKFAKILKGIAEAWGLKHTPWKSLCCNNSLSEPGLVFLLAVISLLPLIITSVAMIGICENAIEQTQYESLTNGQRRDWGYKHSWSTSEPEKPAHGILLRVSRTWGTETLS